jgi:hypothetical protein
MHLIALLIGLLIERLATQFFHWRRMRWVDRFIDAGFHQAERFSHWPAVIPVLILVLLLVLRHTTGLHLFNTRHRRIVIFYWAPGHRRGSG